MKVGSRFLIIPVLILLSMLFLSAVTVPAKASPIKDTGTVYYKDYKQIMVGTWTSSTSLHFTVTTNSSVDVYVLTDTDLGNYPSGAFTPIKSIENTKKADFSVPVTANQGYTLIIDNLDNSRSTDAIPTGDVAYTAAYPNYLDTVTNSVNNAVNICLLSVVAIVIIIVVVVIVIIYFVTRKKKEPQQPVAATPYVMAAPMAQPQYQPVAYPSPPPAPSPYEPPPPSPYEPPPPGQQYQQPPPPR